jgi:hypothetical protein
MVSRREIEHMILDALNEIRALERNLSRRFGALATARKTARMAFLLSLKDLDSRTRRLERLMEALDQTSRYTTPAAA